MRDYCCRLIVAAALATLLGLCPAVASAQEILRGGEVIRTTKSVSHHTVVLGPDSVCVYARAAAVDSTPDVLHQFDAKQRLWDSVQIAGTDLYSANGGLMAGYETLFDSATSGFVRKIWIGRTINDIRTVIAGDSGDIPSTSRIIDIVAHPYSPTVAIVKLGNYPRDFQDAFITTDAGVTWRKFDPPTKAGDFRRLYYYGFDARYPTRIHIAVERDAGFPVPEPLGTRTVYTEDFGQSWTDTLRYVHGEPMPVMEPCLERGVGIWSKVGGLVYIDTSYSGGPKHWWLTSDSLFLEPGEAPRRVQLKWLENARRSMVPDFDSTTETFVYLSTYAIGYHQKWPNVIALGYGYRHPVDTGMVLETLVGMTNDFGKTWTLLFRVPVDRNHGTGEYKAVDDIDLDPSGPHVYVTYRHAKYEVIEGRTQFFGAAYTVRWSSVPTGIEDDGAARTGSSLLRTSPNPVSGSATLRVNLESSLELSSAQDVSIYDASGSLAATCGAHIVSDKAFDVRLPGLAPGVYVLVIRTAYLTNTIGFVVLD